MAIKPGVVHPAQATDHRPGWANWIQGQWHGPSISTGARLLQPLSWVYAALAALDKRLYTWGWRRRYRAPKPLLVVGNMVAGGAGKTPTVLVLIELLRAQGWVPGVISRGHGRHDSEVSEVTPHSTATEVGDEPLMIHLRTGVPVVVGRDRVHAASQLCARHPQVDILVADDGLQHHRLIHDMAVWVFDDRGAGNGLRLPAGPLRQPLPASVPAGALVLYTAGRASTPLRGFAGVRSLGSLLLLQDWWAGRTPDQAETAWQHLAQKCMVGQPIWAAAGLARPEPFFAMLETRGLAVHRLPLTDHHDFSTLPWPPGTEDVIVTEKDAVKLRPECMGNTRVWVATLDFQPEPAFSEALRALTAPYKS